MALDRVRRLPLATLWVFVIKQAWAALFGGLLLAAIILTKYVSLPWFSRFDWLFIIAVAIQLFMLATRLERPREVITIVAFHLTGLGMELFKTSSAIGSWSYAGHAVIHLGNVPLFSGFMYAAVGSYIARAWRVLDLNFSHYPRRRYTVLLALAIYINFFTHHFLPDIRWLLFLGLIVLYYRTWVSYRLNTRVHRMPLLVGFVLIASVIWVAENIGTYTGVWRYPNQLVHWHIVSLGKLGSWLLLMVISFIMVDLLHNGSNNRSRRAQPAAGSD